MDANAARITGAKDAMVATDVTIAIVADNGLAFL